MFSMYMQMEFYKGKSTGNNEVRFFRKSDADRQSKVRQKPSIELKSENAQIFQMHPLLLSAPHWG
jgi:hypothetical protein